jgi:hypothetical protein
LSRRRVVGFYTDRRGRRRPITARRGRRAKTIFFPPKYKRYAEIVRIDTPEAAKLSVKQMKEEFNKAETDAKKRRLKRMVVLAMNRAKVISENPRVSAKERAEAKRVAEIYRRAAEEMKI